jgi:glycosyltransferase involved in cell wall biosynthesis
VELTDFISPAALPEFYKSAGIFCLPSKGEHWGVAVHEAAAAGLPLLLSDTVESGSAFLINGFNGFSFETGNERSFREYLLRMLNMTNDELLKMGENSILLSRRINHGTWSATLNSVID